MIKVYDTHTGKSVILDTPANVYKKGYELYHELGKIHWLSETKFSFREWTYQDKFQDLPDKEEEGIYDISLNKIVSLRAIAPKTNS
jgi:hypothetical protein